MLQYILTVYFWRILIVFVIKDGTELNVAHCMLRHIITLACRPHRHELIAITD